MLQALNSIMFQNVTLYAPKGCVEGHIWRQPVSKRQIPCKIQTSENLRLFVGKVWAFGSQKLLQWTLLLKTRVKQHQKEKRKTTQWQVHVAAGNLEYPASHLGKQPDIIWTAYSPLKV